jgi:arylsulfatase A-like enzyme
MVTIGDDQVALSMMGQVFPQAWVSEPLNHRGDYTLEFFPIVRGTDEPAHFRVLVRMGQVDQDIAFVEATKESEISQSVSHLASPVEIDLAPFRGETIEVIFFLEAPAGDRKGVVGLPRLRPRSASVDRSHDVLMICTDTLRWDTSIGEAGSRLMPVLHSMPGDVVTYRRVFSAASWTMPSITTALTGLYPLYHGAGERAQFETTDPPPGYFRFELGSKSTFLRTYPKDLESLPERLLGAGYSTRLVAGNPLYFPSGLARDGFEIAVHAKVSRGATISRHARGLIVSADPERPLFLLVHYMDPHEWRRRFSRLFGPRSRPIHNPEGARQAYEEVVRRSDSALGVLLEDWGRHRGGNPLIVFWSDHGEHLSEGRLFGYGNSMKEPLLRVPLVVSYPPGLVSRAAEGDRSISLADLTPTVLDAVGVDYDPASLSGVSLLRLAVSGERYHFADYQLYSRELASVRRGDHKLVIDLESGESKLWHVTTEGHETRTENAKLAKELYQAYQNYRAAALEARQDLSPPEDVDQDEALDALRALGYVE